jgi:cyclophilin family peptidyl-prolyl cis-trans isomerase
MGRAQKLKQQRRMEERRKELEKRQKRTKVLFWSIISTLAVCLVALVLVVVLVRLPSYVKQMVIETDRGNIIVEMKDVDAPQTSVHIETMVNNGSYKGANFQVDEVAAATGIQSRDTTAGSDGGQATINARGAVGMAKPSDPTTQIPLADSATNEFYILKQDTPSLDPNFTIFGHVTEGMDVVDAMTQGTAISSITLDSSGRFMTMQQDTGNIVIELDQEGTPQTVQHITDLINSGFYTGMNWYRVEGFVIQTGSHARSLEAAGADTETVSQGSAQDASVPKVVDEIKYVSPVQDPAMLAEEKMTVPMEGKLPAVRGAVMLYWQPQQPQQAQAQSYMPQYPTEFLLMKQDYSEQIGTNFTVFGEVIEGMPVVDSLQTGDKINNIYIREARKD